MKAATMAMNCNKCNERRAMLKRPKTGHRLCRDCFFEIFELEIHNTITAAGLFQRGEVVAIGASGGKDSTVLAHVMKVLNEKYDYGLTLLLLSVDEGITGYRDDSLETVKRNEQQYGMPLRVVSYAELYGWSMDQIVARIGARSNCTFCGVFRRQALDRGAASLGASQIVTGHNADDIAETVLMNVLRGDMARLGRCTDIITSTAGCLPRSKPLKYAYEKEIVMYAHFKRLDYFSTECVYSPAAFRGHVRAYLKDLERVRASSIIDIIHSAEHLGASMKGDAVRGRQAPGRCIKCGYMTSQELCQACVLLQGLNTGRPRMGVGKTSARQRRHMVDGVRRELEGLRVGGEPGLSAEDGDNMRLKAPSIDNDPDTTDSCGTNGDCACGANKEAIEW